MLKTMKIINLLFIVSLTLSNHAMANDIEEGKKLTFDRKKGNCLACHQIEGGKLMGNNGPPLMAMKARFPNKQDLFDQIWDSTRDDPNSYMPHTANMALLQKKKLIR